MNLSLLKTITKKVTHAKKYKNWLNSKELLELQSLAEQVNTLATPSNKQQSQHAGQHNSHNLGSGSDYAESRPYQAGDDPRSINWRLSARSSETFVKTYYADSQPSLNILLDQREPMIFGTRKHLKISQALRVALLLINASKIHGVDFKIWVLSDNRFHVYTNIDELLQQANKSKATDEETSQKFKKGSLNTALNEILPLLTPHSLFYLISDLADAEKESITALAERCIVQIVHILDPAEISLEKIGSISLENTQGTRLLVDTQNELQRLNFTNNASMINHERKKLILDLNISYTCIMTNQNKIQTQLSLPLKAIT